MKGPGPSVLDTGLSGWRGAWFNVVLINVPCALVLGIPLAALRGDFESSV